MPLSLKPSALAILARITLSALTSLTERAKFLSSPLVIPADVTVVHADNKKYNKKGIIAINFFIIQKTLKYRSELKVTKMW